MDTVKQSKFLSYILRHHPETAGLTLDENGWAPVDDVLRACCEKFKGEFTRAELTSLVDSNDKKRFIIEGERIRANQGHSVAIDLALVPTVPPPVLYHGTKTKVLAAIEKEGLIAGSRQHVHLSEDFDTAVVVARRRAGASVILRVETTDMKQPFFKSENGVWLTERVAPEFLYEEAYPDA